MNNNKKRMGVYPGTFSPFHTGHANILHQALNVFDEVIIARGVNPSKSHIEMDEFPIGHPVLRNAKVESFVGLLSDYLGTLDISGGAGVFLIRGLRNGDDLQYEQNQLQFIREMYPSLLTTFFICDRNFEHISSSALRDLKKVSPKEYQKYVFQKPTGIIEPEEIEYYGTDARFWGYGEIIGGRFPGDL